MFISGIPRRREFLYLKHDRLTENQREELLTKLSDEFEAIKFKFSSLAYQTLQSLKDSGKNPGDLYALIEEYVPKKHEILNDLMTKEKIDEIFNRNYWSFFDYELLALIIENCCPGLNEKLSEYVTTFNVYCCRKVSEVPTNFTSMSRRHFVIRVRLGKEFSSLTMKEIKELETSLRKITQIDLSISKFELGSIVVVFLSLSEEDDMLPLSEEGKQKLLELGVLELYSDNYIYFDYKEYTQETNLQAQELVTYNSSCKEDQNSKITSPIKGEHELLATTMIIEPCHEIITEPIDEPMDEPIDEPLVDEPIDKPIDEPMDEPIDEPLVDEPIDKPIDEPMDEPPIDEPMNDEPIDEEAGPQLRGISP